MRGDAWYKRGKGQRVVVRDSKFPEETPPSTSPGVLRSGVPLVPLTLTQGESNPSGTISRIPPSSQGPPTPHPVKVGAARAPPSEFINE